MNWPFIAMILASAGFAILAGIWGLSTAMDFVSGHIFWAFRDASACGFSIWVSMACLIGAAARNFLPDLQRRLDTRSREN
jgi:hypothetical protein